MFHKNKASLGASLGRRPNAVNRHRIRQTRSAFNSVDAAKENADQKRTWVGWSVPNQPPASGKTPTYNTERTSMPSVPVALLAVVPRRATLRAEIRRYRCRDRETLTLLP